MMLMKLVDPSRKGGSLQRFPKPYERSDDKLTWSVVHRVIHKHEIHIVLVLVVEADFLHATLPQI